MQYITALFALVASASIAAAAPDGCSETKPGHYYISSTQNVTDASASKAKRQATTASCSSLDFTLNNGILKDSQSRIGNVVANYQFQFDPPPGQKGFKADSGFSICSNGSLALDSAIFYQCRSGGFYNLYSQSIGEQCNPVYLNTAPCTPSGPESSGGVESISTSLTAIMAESMMAPASTPAASTPAPATTTPSSTLTSAVAAATGTGSSGSSGTNGTVSTAGSPSSTGAPETFKGAASTLAIGQGLVVLAAAFVGFALL